jgi:FtsH-binding integral membrane protein
MATVKKQTEAATGNNFTKTTGNSLFTKDNYMWMVAGLVVMALGFFLMSGGKSADPNVFNKDEVYSTTRITIAPILIIAGLLLEIFAIMKKPKTNE